MKKVLMLMVVLIITGCNTLLNHEIKIYEILNLNDEVKEMILNRKILIFKFNYHGCNMYKIEKYNNKEKVRMIINSPSEYYRCEAESNYKIMESVSDFKIKNDKVKINVNLSPLILIDNDKMYTIQKYLKKEKYKKEFESDILYVLKEINKIEEEIEKKENSWIAK